MYEVSFFFFLIAIYHNKRLQVDCLSNVAVFTGQVSWLELNWQIHR